MDSHLDIQEGVYFGMSFADYRAANAVSQSTLKAFGSAATALHFKTAKPKVATSDMEFGTIAHCAILEPERLQDAYHLQPSHYTAKDGQKPWHGGAAECKKWLAAHADKPVMTRDDMDRIPKIVASLGKLEEFSSALANGQREVSFFKRDSETGLLLKCRCDVLATDGDGYSWIFDPKKVLSGCAAHDEFSKSAYDYGYHIQSASYLAITGASRFVFVPFDDAEPFDAAQFEPDSDMIATGWKEYRRLLNAYAACVTSGEWPGYSHSITPLALPGWVKRGRKYEGERKKDSEL